VLCGRAMTFGVHLLGTFCSGRFNSGSSTPWCKCRVCEASTAICIEWFQLTLQDYLSRSAALALTQLAGV
jgi:hypothetical protein